MEKLYSEQMLKIFAQEVESLSPKRKFEEDYRHLLDIAAGLCTDLAYVREGVQAYKYVAEYYSATLGNDIRVASVSGILKNAPRLPNPFERADAYLKSGQCAAFLMVSLDRDSNIPEMERLAEGCAKGILENIAGFRTAAEKDKACRMAIRCETSALHRHRNEESREARELLIDGLETRLENARDLPRNIERMQAFDEVCSVAQEWAFVPRDIMEEGVRGMLDNEASMPMEEPVEKGIYIPVARPDMIRNAVDYSGQLGAIHEEARMRFFNCITENISDPAKLAGEYREAAESWERTYTWRPTYDGGPFYNDAIKGFWRNFKLITDKKDIKHQLSMGIDFADPKRPFWQGLADEILKNAATMILEDMDFVITLGQRSLRADWNGKVAPEKIAFEKELSSKVLEHLKLLPPEERKEAAKHAADLSDIETCFGQGVSKLFKACVEEKEAVSEKIAEYKSGLETHRRCGNNALTHSCMEGVNKHAESLPTSEKLDLLLFTAAHCESGYSDELGEDTAQNWVDNVKELFSKPKDRVIEFSKAYYLSEEEYGRSEPWKTAYDSFWKDCRSLGYSDKKEFLEGVVKKEEARGNFSDGELLEFALEELKKLAVEAPKGVEADLRKKRTQYDLKR